MNYLNSNFLNTAEIVKTANNTLIINFLEYIETPAMRDETFLKLAEKQVIAENRDKKIDSVLYNKEYTPTKLEDTTQYKESTVGYPSITLSQQAKTVDLETITLPKEKNILREYLSDIYYNKILELSKLNDKSVKINTPQSCKNRVYQKIKKYIYNELDFLCFGKTDIEISRSIFIKIIQLCNNIAMNSRIGPGSFCILHPDMVKYLFNYENFTNSSTVRQTGEKYSLVGKLENIDVFINPKQDKNLIIAGSCGKLHGGGILIGVKDEDIGDNIKWTGKIFSSGNNAKYMYENLKIGILMNLPWHKKMLYKLFRKKF